MKNNLLCLAMMITLMFACKPKPVVESGDLPYMPMKAVYENSLKYAWSQKKVLNDFYASSTNFINKS